MIAKINIFGSIGLEREKGSVFLSDIKRQLDEVGRYNAVHVLINSPGGSVTEGRAIKQYLKTLDVPITTEAIGQCSSIASEIFLAGQKRIIHEGCEMLIHFPRGGYEGTAEQMAQYADDLFAVQDEMVKQYLGYMEKKTRGQFTYKQVEKMLRKETRLSGEQAYAMGLASEYKKTIISKSNKQVMANSKKQDPSALSKMWKGFLAMIGRQNTALDLVLQDGTPVYVDTEEDLAQVGDAVFLVSTGEPAPDGEHILQDGSILVTVGGLITEIRPAGGSTSEPTSKVSELEAQIQALQAQLDAEKQATAKKDEDMKALQENLENVTAFARQTMGAKFELFNKGEDKNTSGQKKVPVVGVKRDGLEKYIPKK